MDAQSAWDMDAEPFGIKTLGHSMANRDCRGSGRVSKVPTLELSTQPSHVNQQLMIYKVPTSALLEKPQQLSAGGFQRAASVGRR